MLKSGKIVALDTTRNLLMNSARKVRLQLSPDSLPLELHPFLLQEESGYHVLKLDEFSDLETMLGTLRMCGISVKDMVLPHPDLEEVFVEIMKSR